MTFWLKVIVGWPDFVIVPLTIPARVVFVPLIVSTYTVKSAELVAGNGNTFFTNGSRSAAAPVVSSKTLPQIPACISGASGFQSTVQKDRSTQLCLGGVINSATALAPPLLIKLVTLYSCMTIVPTAFESSSVPLSQICAR